MKIDPRGFLTRYTTTALVVFNTLVVLVLFNGFVYAIIVARDTNESPLKDLYPNVSWQEVYPNLDPSEIELLLHETSSIPLEYEPYTQYRESEYSGRFFTVSRQGFRHSSDQQPWPPDPERFNVFIFGGSTTFGYGVADDETIASHLTSDLSELVTEDVGVYNFGRAGYRSTQERVLFEELLLAGFVPDLVIFIDGLNDFASRGLMFTPQFRRAIERERQSGLSTLGEDVAGLPMVRLVRYLMRDAGSADAGPQSSGQQPDNSDYIRNIVQLYIENKKLTEALADANSTRAVFVWQPVPMYGYDLQYHLFGEGGFTRVNRHAAAGYAYMAELAGTTDLGDDFYSCADVQRGLREPLYVDKIHYSDRMNGIVSECITDYLMEREPNLGDAR